MHCSPRSLKIVVFTAVVLCICVATLVTFFVLKDKGSNTDGKGSNTDDPSVSGLLQGTQASGTNTTLTTTPKADGTNETLTTTPKANGINTTLTTTPKVFTADGTNATLTTTPKAEGTNTTVTTTPKADGTNATLTTTPKAEGTNTTVATTPKTDGTNATLTTTPKVLTAEGTNTTVTTTPKIFTADGTNATLTSTPKVLTAYGTNATLTTTPKADGTNTTLTITPKGTNTTVTTTPKADGTNTTLTTTPKVFTADGTNTTLTTTPKADGINTTLTTTPKYVTFTLSKNDVYIGDSDVQMVCQVMNYSGLTKVEIHRELAASGTIQIIARITPDNMNINTSRIKLTTGNITYNSALVHLNFTNQVACEDNGLYYCIVTGAWVSNTTLKLDLLRKPSKPSLTLSRDMVEGKENQAELPFICQGDVGFPAGNLVIDSNFTSNFYPRITINTTISKETCQAYQKVTFYYAFSRDWHGKEIRCSAVNNQSLRQNEIPPFDKQLVEVVPAAYCPNLQRGQYYHPYNCTNYIDCVNGNVNVGLCPGTLCFGVYETNGCNYCTNTTCNTDIVDRVCNGSNAKLVPYTSRRCSMYVNCTERLVHDCPQNKCFDVLDKTCPSWTPFITGLNCSVTEYGIGSNATILCAVGDVRISSVIATVRPSTGGEISLFYVTGVLQPGVLNTSLTATLKLSGIGPNQTLSLEIHRLQCNQTGQYIINVNSNISGVINLTAKADVPVITVPNITNENGTLEIRCRGHVGTPAKQIVLEVQFYGSSTFQAFSAENKTNTTSKENDCNNERETVFTIFATSYWDNGTVRCSVRNDDNSVLSSEQKKIIIVKSTVTFEPSKREAYIGDSDLSMTCKVSSHQDLRRVEIYYESSTLGTKEIAAVEPQSKVTYMKGIILSEAAFMKDNANVTIGFTYNLTCNDDGIYHCKAVGAANFTFSIKLRMSSEPEAPTLTLSPWIQENKPILADRMFRCAGMVGRPEGLMFVEANISGSFQRYDFPSVINNTQVNCNTNQSYQFYYTFNMSWHGRDIRCAVKSAKTNKTIESPPKTIEVVNENYCIRKGDNAYYPHPFECTKYIGCNQDKIFAINLCGPGLCWGVNQTTGCTYCNNQSKDLTCLPGARKY